MIFVLWLWSKQWLMGGIYQKFHLQKNHFTVCLNMLHVSSRCCIIPSPMTESKIGHLCSTRDITLLGLIGTDCRGEKEGQRDSAKIQRYGVTGHFQNVVVHQFCIKSFLFVYPSVLNALLTTAFSNCFQMPRERGIFSSSVPLSPRWETGKKRHIPGRESDFCGKRNTQWD